MKKLLKKCTPGNERCGFIIRRSTIVEVDNIATNPHESFDVRGEDLVKWVFQEGAIASWHTHPGGTTQLSNDDYIAFRNYPDLKHYIVTETDIACYVVNGKGAIVREA